MFRYNIIKGFYVKKIVGLSIIICSCFILNLAFCQSNDEKALDILDTHLQSMFQILNTKPQGISLTCVDSLKKLHSFKEQFIKNENNSNTQKDIDITILRALYSNSIQFCETDVQSICSKRVEQPIRKICKKIFNHAN